MASEHVKQKNGAGKLVALLLVISLIMAVTGGLLIKSAYDEARYPLAYEEQIKIYAQKYDLEPAFVAAVINTESSFDPNAHSDADAIGLMQIQKDTFDWAKSKLKEERKLTEKDLYDPVINIQYGCAIYRLLLDEFKDMSTAVAAYHAGWGNVKRWLSDPAYSDDGVTLNTTPFGDTNHYMSRIMKDQKQYQKRYEEVWNDRK